ncbi:hypothetical protein M9978_20810 [Sphingomonas sp. MG17]|jgi:hypothetical protein|uniref:Lipoprotein-attachment site-containing protein n=1 Tax=Sphingomonas tagetis TaxID=2949092 RepID=A0A9X2KMQ0_9SPHN|nr:hypothetical protein [Sphingomonas tagetis]MCP3732864.1 hypothetical protein [Sphingomonas tagetis]
MRTLVVFSAILLAACGNKGELKPAAGGSLPPKPYGAVATPTPTDLVQAPPQTRPTRSDEVLRSSQERRSDEFTLPPQ